MFKRKPQEIVLRVELTNDVSKEILRVVHQEMFRFCGSPPGYFHSDYSIESRLSNRISKLFRKTLKELAQDDLQEFTRTEEFLDQIVERLHKKQLKS